MDLNHRSSRYERDEIDLFSNLLKTLWMGFQESQARLKIFFEVEPPFRLELNSEVYKTPASPCMLWRPEITA